MTLISCATQSRLQTKELSTHESRLNLPEWHRINIVMKQKALRLTGLVRKEGDEYSSLCLELDVASCGKTREEAFAGLKAAVETYVTYLVEEGRENEIYRPVPQEAMREFLRGEVHERKFTTLYVVPLDFSYASSAFQPGRR